ncbi:MAG: caspase family protein, partial [Trichodesmium sp. St16_bin2-tuft]|nr:caspase family protein [Trichodesmium sp. St16_bin2-tuft]
MERRRALLIGITIFGEGLDNFSSTLEDVQVMKKCLEEKGGFEVIKEENLDRKDMEYVINKFFYESQKSDTLLIYVSSHGITDAEGTFYIATS